MGRNLCLFVTQVIYHFSKICVKGKRGIIIAIYNASLEGVWINVNFERRHPIINCQDFS